MANQTNLDLHLHTAFWSVGKRVAREESGGGGEGMGRTKNFGAGVFSTAHTPPTKLDHDEENWPRRWLRLSNMPWGGSFSLNTIGLVYPGTSHERER